MGLSPTVEAALRNKFTRDSEALAKCKHQCKGLEPKKRKRIVNKKASRVSRIRTKLFIYELVRKYKKSLEDREYYKSKLRELTEQLAPYV